VSLRKSGRVLSCVLLLAGCSAAPSSEPPVDPMTPEVTEEGLREINGTELFVKRVGAGEPIVVVHGGPMLEHGYLLSSLEPLADDYELIFYDQRLSGRSAPEVDPASVTVAAFVEDIEGLRESLGLDSFHLMAHSWGGLLAQHYAIRHGDRLRSLILLDSMAPTAELWQREESVLAERVTDEARAEREEMMASEAFANREPEAIRDLLLLSFRTQFVDPTRVSELDLYVPEDYMARSQRFGALGPELESFDLREALASVTTPTLVLYGADEPAAGLGGVALEAALPDAELVTIGGAGHFPFIEQPEAFQEAVRRFLESVRDRSQ
jgi:proline iminopeptidase